MNAGPEPGAVDIPTGDNARMTTHDNSVAGSALGRHVDYPQGYDPDLLYPIARTLGRHAIGLRDAALPFIGHDRWHAYELSWLDAKGKPQVATATFQVPADAPNLVESKSLKLYLNSLNSTRFNSDAAVLERIATDLSARAGADVQVVSGLPPMADAPEGESIDGLDVEIDHYGPPRAEFLAADPEVQVEETLSSELLKSNCPVTGQPDWATVVIRYRGPRIDRIELLRYLVSFRDHAEFHEQCVERIFHDVLAHCRPASLSVEARYTRRGGLDINPWRSTDDMNVPLMKRDIRQ